MRAACEARYYYAEGYPACAENSRCLGWAWLSCFISISIFAALILISRCEGGSFLHLCADEDRSLGGHCWRIVGMELTSAVLLSSCVFFFFLRCFIKRKLVEPVSVDCRLVYTIVFVHYAWMSGVYVLFYRGAKQFMIFLGWCDRHALS